MADPYTPQGMPGFAELDNIEPVNPRFFSAVARDSQLSNSAKERLVQTALNGRLELEKARSEIVRARQSETLNDLRIQREEFMLSEARRRAQEDRDAVQKSGEIASSFQSILDDPELDPDAKRDALGRIRIAHADTFARSASLRDQYATADSLLPPQAKPLTLSERLALRRAQIYEGKVVTDDARAEDARQRKMLKDELDYFDGSFKPLESPKFKKDPNGAGLGDTFLDEFENPATRTAAIEIINEYGPDVGVVVENPADLGANDLLAYAGEIRAKFRSALRREGGGAPGSVDSLGIPVE